MFKINDSAFQNYQKLQKQYYIIQHFNVIGATAVEIKILESNETEW